MSAALLLDVHQVAAPARGLVGPHVGVLARQPYCRPARQPTASSIAPIVAPAASVASVRGMAFDAQVLAAVRAAFPGAGAAAAVPLGAPVHDGQIHPEPLIGIPLAMMNRHGLVAGATGTGKTKTLQLIAEALSAAGVPVFVADIKGTSPVWPRPGGPARRSRVARARSASPGARPDSRSSSSASAASWARSSAPRCRRSGRWRSAR